MKSTNNSNNDPFHPLSDEDYEIILNTLKKLEKLLIPYLEKLTMEEKKHLTEMKEEYFQEIEEAIKHAREDESLLYPNVDLDEVERQLELSKVLSFSMKMVLELEEALGYKMKRQEEMVINTYTMLFGGHQEIEEDGKPDVEFMFKKIMEHARQDNKDKTN